MDGLHATAIAAVTSALVFLPIYVLFLKKGIGETAWGDIALQGFYQGVLTWNTIAAAAKHMAPARISAGV